MVTRQLTNTDLEGRIMDLFSRKHVSLDLLDVLRELEFGLEMDQIVLEAIWRLVGKDKLKLTQDRKFAEKSG